MIPVYSYSDPVYFTKPRESWAFYGQTFAFLDGTYGVREWTETFNWDTRTPELASTYLNRMDVISGRFDAKVPMTLEIQWAGGPTAQMLDGRYLETGHVYATSTTPEVSFLQFRTADGAISGHKIYVGGASVSPIKDLEVLPGGGFIVTWNQYHAGSDWDVAAQIFNKFGKPVTDVLTQEVAGDQTPPAVAVLSPSRFVETWVDKANGWTLNTRVFDMTGAPVTDVVSVRYNPDSYSSEYDVVALSNGNFAIVWADIADNAEDQTATNSFDVRIFSATGAAVSGTVVVASIQSGPGPMEYIGGISLIALQDGGFAVSWGHSIEAPPNDFGRQFYSSSLLQTYDSTGKVASPLYGLGPNDGLEVGTGIVALADGRIAVTWDQFDPETRENKQATQILDPRVHGIDLTGNALADQYAGSTFADAIRGLAGDDTLYGNAGNDVLIGGTGNDMLLGGFGYDKLIGNDGNDYLSGFDGNDRLVGGKGADLVVGGRGSDVFVFAPGDGADRIKGFTNGVDRIDLSAYGFEHGWMALRHFAEVAGGIQFTAGQDTILITGLAFVDLGGSDLIL